MVLSQNQEAAYKTLNYVAQFSRGEWITDPIDKSSIIWTQLFKKNWYWTNCDRDIIPVLLRLFKLTYDWISFSTAFSQTGVLLVASSNSITISSNWAFLKCLTWIFDRGFGWGTRSIIFSILYTRCLSAIS